jgi:hypothetical protein
MNASLADPHLAAIRSVANLAKVADHQLGRELESARFNLFRAIEAGRRDEARAWLGAVELAVEAAAPHIPAGAATRALASALAGLRQVVGQ